MNEPQEKVVQPYCVLLLKMKMRGFAMKDKAIELRLLTLLLSEISTGAVPVRFIPSLFPFVDKTGFIESIRKNPSIKTAIHYSVAELFFFSALGTERS